MKEKYIKLNISPLVAKDVIEYSLRPLREQIQAKQLRLSINVEENLPNFEGDLEKICWVLLNILSNALRYTPRWGTIEVSVALDKGSIGFSVKDSGSGISDAMLPRVFDSLIVKPEEKQKVRGGYGLALSISKEIIEAHDGSITVASKNNEGSLFRFYLPIKN